MNKKEVIEVLSEIRDSTSKYEQYEVKPYDVEALDYAIKLYRRNCSRRSNLGAVYMKYFIKFMFIYFIIYLLITEIIHIILPLFI